MEISVNTISGKTITLKVVPSLNIEVMKAMIRDKEGIPPKQQVLTFGRWMLMNDRTLSDFNIQNENTISMHIRSRVGTESSVPASDLLVCINHIAYINYDDDDTNDNNNHDDKDDDDIDSNAATLPWGLE